MQDRQDAFGRALLDVHLCHTSEGIVVIERDDGFVACDSLRQYFTGYRKWSPFSRRAIRCAKGNCLDIGAGAGRHSLYLQNKGFRVTAIDVSPASVKLCRLRGIKDVRMRGIEQLGPEDGRFDTVFMLGNNFGLLGSFRKARRLLKQLAACTSGTAQLLAENLDPYKTKDPLHLAYHRRNRRRRRMGGQVHMRIRYNNCATPWFDYLLVSDTEIRRIVDGTGWEIGDLVQDHGPMYFLRLVKTRRTPTKDSAARLRRP